MWHVQVSEQKQDIQAICIRNAHLQPHTPSGIGPPSYLCLRQIFKASPHILDLDYRSRVQIVPGYWCISHPSVRMREGFASRFHLHMASLLDSANKEDIDQTEETVCTPRRTTFSCLGMIGDCGISPPIRNPSFFLKKGHGIMEGGGRIEAKGVAIFIYLR